MFLKLFIKKIKINKKLMTFEHSNLLFYFQLVREDIINRKNGNETQGVKNYKDFITGSI